MDSPFVSHETLSALSDKEVSRLLARWDGWLAEWEDHVYGAGSGVYNCDPYTAGVLLMAGVHEAERRIDALLAELDRRRYWQRSLDETRS